MPPRLLSLSPLQKAKLLAFRTTAQIYIDRKLKLPKIPHVYIRLYGVLLSLWLCVVGTLSWYPRVHPWYFFSFLYFSVGMAIWCMELSLLDYFASRSPLRMISKTLVKRSEAKIALYNLLGLVVVISGILPLKRTDGTLMNSVLLISFFGGGGLWILGLLYALSWLRRATMDKKLNPGDLRVGLWKGRIGFENNDNQKKSKGDNGTPYVKM